MKKLFFFLALLISAVAIPSMAAAQPGGLLDGKPFNFGGVDKHEMTDNNESTGLRIYKSTASYVSPTSMDITSFYMSEYDISSGTGVTFKDSAGKVLYRAGNGYNQDDNLRFSNKGTKVLRETIKNVTTVEVGVGGGNDAIIYEFDVFGTMNLESPVNVKVQPDIKSATVTFTKPNDSVATWIYVNDEKKEKITGESYKIEGLAPDVPVKVQLTAVYAGDIESPKTAPFMVTPMMDIIKPDFKADPKFDGVTLSWKPITGAKTFKVYRKDLPKEILSLGPEGTGGKDSSVKIGSTYEYYMVYEDKYSRSIQSDTVTVTIPEKPVNTTPPESPKSFSASMAGNMKDINLHWLKGTEDDLSGYNLYVSKDDEEYTQIAKMIKNNAFTYSGESEQKYYFKLEAINESGLVSDPANTSITVPKRTTDSDQQETTEYLLVTWTKTEGAVGYVIYLNNREVGRVGPDVFSFKITKAMGYIPGALINKSEVKAIYADGSTGEGSGGGNGGSGGGGGPLDDALSFIGVNDMIEVAIDFLKLYKVWIILILAVIFSPVLYGLIVKLIQYVNRRNAVNAVKRR